MATQITATDLTLELQIIANSPWLPSEAQFKSWVLLAIGDHMKTAELCLRVVDKNEIQQLNYRYRGLNKATNVLAFPFESPVTIEPPLLGDLVICGEIVAIQAEQQKKRLEAHWAHMVVHGCLHLLGYDHTLAIEAEKMESLEIKLIENLGFTNPYEEQ